jgi:mono/diheme cytochrome c family protein
MRTTNRRGGRILLALVVIVIVAIAALALWPTTTAPMNAAQNAADDALVQRGRYVATAADCVACHTAPGGKPYAGGLSIATPLGAVYSTNITPERNSGIGGYTLDEFSRALRYGVRKDGDTLYPAMPYPSYARMNDADITALYAYFMHGVQAVDEKNKDADIKWPLSMRWPLALWRRAFGPSDEDRRFDPARYADSRIALGAYLVQGAGHCGACHTPREKTLNEQGLNEASKAFLAGGPVIDGWVAPNLRGDKGYGLGDWSEEDIVNSLRNARNPHSAVVGKPMQDVVLHSTQQLTNEDLHAMAAYLKTLAPVSDQPRYVASDETAKALKAGKNSGRGAEIYADSCAACHRSEGTGNPHAFPSMAGNPTVLQDDPTSLIRLILGGGQMLPTRERPSNLGMPAFDWRLSDQEVAELTTFMRSGWGNHAAAVDAAAVMKVRDAMKQEAKTSGPQAVMTTK